MLLPVVVSAVMVGLRLPCVFDKVSIALNIGKGCLHTIIIPALVASKIQEKRDVKIYRDYGLWI